NAFWLLC
ncbi:hypothetical protein D039_1330B, partial [Vibrio parahaemolyticus EKP-028]